jgi:hypothetical protein
VPFDTQFLKILCFRKILNKIAAVKGAISFEIQDIFIYQISTEDQCLSQKKCFSLLFAIFDPFSWKKYFEIKKIFECA